MKAPFVILLFFSYPLLAQLHESFESGTLAGWQQYPINRWEISSQEPIPDGFSLHHSYDNSLAYQDQISLIHAPLYLDSLTASWKFSIRHGYNPSSENCWAVYIVSDHPAGYLTSDSNINAYAVGVNLTGNDDLLKLWKIKNNEITTVVNTGFNWQTGTSLFHMTKLFVTRTIHGNWSVSMDTAGTENSLFFLDDGIDNEINRSNYVGLCYRYSSGQDRKLWFDDLEVTGFFTEDKSPPEIEKFSILSSDSARIEFSEPINTRELSLDMFTVTGEPGHPAKLVIQNSDVILMKFNAPFLSGETYKIRITNCRDIYGNLAGLLEKEFSCYFAGAFDVVINEIMADPEPAEQLPDAEFVEIYNTTAFPIQLNGWKLVDGDNRFKLPDIAIGGGEYLIFCGEEEALLLSKFGTFIPFASFPALNNEGQSLTLLNSEDVVIHTISFNKKWYRNEYKSEGGWSLEMIDPENPCGKIENWSDSDNSLGGTPGFRNSVSAMNPDIISPSLVRSSAIYDTALLVTFSEFMLPASISDPSAYSVDNGIFHPVEVLPVSPGFSAVFLSFEARFAPSIQYELMINSVPDDCAGNQLNDSFVKFALAEEPDSLNIVVNEIMFDAQGNEEFVEIFNRSGKTIDLSHISLALLENSTGSVKKIVYEFPPYFHLLPEEYAAVTSDIASLQKLYYCKIPSSLVEADEPFALPDQEGIIALIDKENNLIDLFHYEADYHFELIRNTEGISLERISSENPTNDPGNWHSAAQDAGNATPGFKNSQSFSTISVPLEEVWIEPEVFTPDNDGENDFITLQYSFTEPGYIASVIVFDSRGRAIRQLADNLLLGTEGFLTWDGINSNGLIEECGIYVVYMELFSSAGRVIKFKNTCILAIKNK